MATFELRILLVVTSFLAGSSCCLGQDNSCAQFKTTAEQSQCASQQLQAAEHDLTLAFDGALQNYTESEVKKNEKQSLPKAGEAEQIRWDKMMLGKLKDSQRAWLTYVESACGTVEAMHDGGTISSAIVPLCKADLTRERTKFLQHYFTKDE